MPGQKVPGQKVLGFFERVGLVRSEYDDLPVPATAVRLPEDAYTPEVPEIDATQVSYDDIIRSIYQQSDIDDSESIFKIKAYIDILPPEMTKSKKQMSIAGIFAVNNISVENLFADGNKRIHVLNAASESIKTDNDAIISEAEQDIEHLKSMIEAAEAKIAEAKKRTSDAYAAIHEEIEAINQLLDFADGITSKEGET